MIWSTALSAGRLTAETPTYREGFAIKCACSVLSCEWGELMQSAHITIAGSFWLKVGETRMVNEETRPRQQATIISKLCKCRQDGISFICHTAFDLHWISRYRYTKLRFQSPKLLCYTTFGLHWITKYRHTQLWFHSPKPLSLIRNAILDYVQEAKKKNKIANNIESRREQSICSDYGHKCLWRAIIKISGC